MKVDNALILKLEKLARLQFNEQEREKIIKDLSAMLDMVDKLKELDTSHINLSDGEAAKEEVLRDDVVKKHLTQEEALKNSPDQKDGYFIVPKVVKK